MNNNKLIRKNLQKQYQGIINIKYPVIVNLPCTHDFFHQYYFDVL